MNKSDVPHSEIAKRLSICQEFLHDEKKPVEEAYKSWVRNENTEDVGEPTFTYWFKRFQNNQFDLGYDPSLDLLKEVPEYFQSYIQEWYIEGKKSTKRIDLRFHENRIYLREFSIYMKKTNDGYSFEYHRHWFDYKETEEPRTKITENPVEYIIKILRFLLKDPEDLFIIEIRGVTGDYLFDLKKMSSALQSLFDSIGHKIAIQSIDFKYFHEDAFFSLVKRSKPGVLQNITIDIKCEDSNKWRDIVKDESWKHIVSLSSEGLSPLKFNDVNHCKKFELYRKRVTPEEIGRIKIFFSKAKNAKTFTIHVKKEEDEDMLQEKDIKEAVKKNCISELPFGEYEKRIGYRYDSLLPYNVTLTASTVKFDNNPHNF